MPRITSEPESNRKILNTALDKAKELGHDFGKVFTDQGRQIPVTFCKKCNAIAYLGYIGINVQVLGTWNSKCLE